MSESPYANKDKSEWKSITKKLVDEHPLAEDFIVRVVHAAWNNIFNTSIGSNNLRIGTNIFPKPQVIGALLHELIQWSGEVKKVLEIKTLYTFQMIFIQ